MSILRQQVFVQIEGTVNWQTAQDPSTGVWIGVCNELNLNATGDRWDDLLDAMKEAKELLFHDLLESGQLDTFLRSHGWRSSPLPTSPKAKVKFEVPFSLTQARSVRELVSA